MKLTISRLITILFVASLTVLSGCASILDGGRTKPVEIRSTPSGADVVITNSKTGVEVFKGKTPTVVSLNRAEGFFKGASYSLKLTLDGYAPQTVHFQSSISGWYVGNILFGGLIGIVIVDPATGAMYTLPKEQTVELVKQSGTASTQDGKNTESLVVMDINEVPESLRPLLVALD